jgi:uncharacterized protein (TIGR00369 family)
VGAKGVTFSSSVSGSHRVNETRAVISLSELQQHLQGSPFHQLFDLSCVRVDHEAGELELRMRYTSSVERSPGTRQYHGGPIASLIDIAGDYVLWAVLGYGVPTINLRIDYLRPASATDLRAVARIRRVGRTVGVVDIDVIDDQGRVIAIGRGSYGTKAG